MKTQQMIHGNRSRRVHAGGVQGPLTFVCGVGILCGGFGVSLQERLKKFCASAKKPLTHPRKTQRPHTHWLLSLRTSRASICMHVLHDYLQRSQYSLFRIKQPSAKESGIELFFFGQWSSGFRRCPAITQTEFECGISNLLHGS